MRASCLIFAAVAAAGCNAFSDAPSGASGGSGGAGGGAASGLPCDVDRVLAQSCRSCHADPPRYGAPMPLVTYADTQAPAPTNTAEKVVDVMHQRIHDPTSPMPPTGPLDAAALDVLDRWYQEGAPPGDGAACDEGAGGTGPAIGPDALSCTPTQKLVAHGTSGGAFHVPSDAANLYECFTFKSPWNGATEGTAWAPIIGDARVLHQWILYRSATPQPDGGVGPCNMPADATFVAGWAPGGTNFVLPKDVGLELAGPNDSLILQVHYHNIAGYTDADDASGVALCTTNTPREHLAGVFTLGTVDISIPPHANGYTTSGMCPSWATSFLPQPLTIIATFPHMHGLGRSIKTEVLRGGDTGPAETLVDVQHFSFDSQTFYRKDPPMTFNPGDAARTTCVYDNPGNDTVSFGERTEDEMCFDFVMLYPINLLTGNNRSCGLF
ncbi:MAG TPA: hypothetical protein VHB21_22970 [Minicystis sp.]|nr:hypothetical protein [Minicystis sp.]